MRQHPLATLGDGIYWAQSHWNVRELPLRLHQGGVEPESRLGAPRAAAQFLAYLMATPDDRLILTEQSVCWHPQMAKGSDGYPTEPLVRCPDCGGLGTSQKSGERWRYPMWRALRQVASGVGKPHQPHPIILIAAMVLNAWEPEHAAAFLSLAPEEASPLFLMALRKLHDRYESGPLPRRSWVDLSDSQRSAEAAA